MSATSHELLDFDGLGGGMVIALKVTSGRSSPFRCDHFCGNKPRHTVVGGYRSARGRIADIADASVEESNGMGSENLG